MIVAQGWPWKNLQTLYERQTKAKRARDVSQVIEHLLGKTLVVPEERKPGR
jgi:hypothetical protein